MKTHISLCSVIGLIILLLIPYFAAGQDYTGALEDALVALKIGDYSEARKLFRPLLELDTGDDREKVMGYFETFIDIGEYTAGLEEIEKYLEKTPEDPFLLNMKGRLLILTGKYDEAEKAFIQSRMQKFDYWRNLIDLGEYYTKVGRRYEANSFYNELINQYNRGNLTSALEAGYTAKAMAASGQIHEANNTFNFANRIEPENVHILQWWAELFLEEFAPDLARANYEEALEINPSKADLYSGYARALENFAAREEMALLALEKNPNCVEAHNIIVEILILDSRYDEAEQKIKRILEINPSSIETLAYLAAIHHLRNETEKFVEVERQALSINPNSGQFYFIIGENCVRRFRYKDAFTFGYNAIARNPQHWRAYAMVGINLHRTGDTQQAYRYLSRAYDNDQFNVFASNTLNLIDTYKDFETLESEHFKLLIHKSESVVLGKSILDLAEENFDSLSTRYPYRPEGKIQIEAYNNHDDFAVRISGLPELELLGVCFGDVIAFDTPKAQSDYADQMGLSASKYNWSRSLWHELAHVMALGLSDHRVPRWFTEGLAVYEEKRSRQEWARDLELELYAALDQDKLLTLEEINLGFTRPKFPGQLYLTYYQSARLIEFIAGKYGFEAITALLTEFGNGTDLETSFMNVLKDSPENVEEEFFNELHSEMQKYKNVLTGLPDLFGEEKEVSFLEKLTGGTKNPFLEKLKEGYEHFKNLNYDEAERKFLEAIELFPNFIEPGNPYEGLAQVYRAQGQRTKLQEILKRYLSISEHAETEARELAGMLREDGMLEEAEYYYKRSIQVQPYAIATYTNLAEIYKSRELFPKEIEERRIIIALNPLDKSKAYYNLALSLFNNGQTQEAKMEVLKSLEIAPGFRDAQKLLLKCIQFPN
ncbi:hypothetical protein AMJ80_02535 [bacterium SM23_31]|nr:MAG: hypothetical protein AMJ80_02535 [bacterium SM23_31]